MLPNTLTLKLYVVKEKIWNHTKSIEHKSNKQVLANPRTKGLPPSVFREHTVDMGLQESLRFLDTKGLVEYLFQNREVHCSC